MRDYLHKRETLLRVAVPSIDSARQLAALTDRVLADMALAAASKLPPRTRWSLLALGGYGSGALLPGSDLDLLVVSNASSSALRPFVEDILYPLWDAGLNVGHQVRSRREQIAACREDTATMTSTLTARVIAGDSDLGDQVIATCAADARKRRTSVLAALGERERPGSPYLLEPDLKEGAGGRRDFDELTWTAAVLTGERQSDPSALIKAELLTTLEYERLIGAAEIVAAARWETQLSGGGSLMSLEDADALSAVHPQDVQKALADTHHTLLAVRGRIGGTSSELDPVCTPDKVIELCRAGRDSLPLLEKAAWSGALDALVPAMSKLITLRRPGIAHQLTVGAHCLLAATLIGSEVAADTLATRSRSALAEAELTATIVSALVHDIGKINGGIDHGELGAAPARESALLFQLSAQDADLVADLVRLHLVLAQSASSVDLDEEDSILRVASAVGERRLVAPLHLLTIADSIATGPSAWSDWHAALVGKLVTRLDAALSPGVEGAGIAEHARQVRTAALTALDSEPDLHAFVTEAPLRYLAGRTAEEIVGHARLAARLAARNLSAAFETLVTMGPIQGTHVVTIAAFDRPGLFADLAGAFALTGLDILNIEAVSGSSHIALDTFVVKSTTRAATGTSTWTNLERHIDASLRGRLSLGVRLAERARHYDVCAPTAPTSVNMETEDPFAVVLTIKASDRVGLLHDIARAVTDSGLDIAAATAIVRDGRVKDVFRLVDPTGAKPDDPGLLGQLAMRLREMR